MKLTHKGREIEPNAVDYGDGTVMVMYTDAGDAPNVAIVPKTEITVEEEKTVPSEYQIGDTILLTLVVANVVDSDIIVNVRGADLALRLPAKNDYYILERANDRL